MKNPLYIIERCALKILRKVVYKGKKVPNKTKLMSGEELNDWTYKHLIDDKPLMVARYGSIELDAATYPYVLTLPLWKRYKLYMQQKIVFLHKDKDYENSIITPLCNNAGFFPQDTHLIEKYSKRMQEDTKACCCCCWCWNNEDLFADIYSKNIVFAKLEDMEPYDYSKPWSRALVGKKVLVIHPFAKTIESQYARRELLFENKEVLPEFELITIKAVQSIAGEKTPFKDWFEALAYMEKQMDAVDYDVAIIGCGAYGFPLAAHAKRMGKKAIHLGGATQCLFGIKGKRWEEIPEVAALMNEYWVRPLPEETPQENKKVEDGCYW